MKFPDAFLDELRARVPVSEIVGRKFKLRKVGHEFRAVDDKSLTVNDQKGLWWDHAKNEGGDAFKFLVDVEGLTFPEAVKTDRKSTRLNSSHRCISYAVFCLKK